VASLESRRAFRRSLVNLMSLRHGGRRRGSSNESSVQSEPDNGLLAQSGADRPEAGAVTGNMWHAPFIAPSMSDYDITYTSRRAAPSIGGPGDFFFLGLGTTLFGTSDRVHSPSAGWIGWHHHPPGFREVRWHPDWVRFGYFSNHTSSSAVRFVQHALAPLCSTT
jgi:hypothetical protein